jgi:hypothetical protein
MKLHGHVYFQSNCYLDLYIVHSQNDAKRILAAQNVVPVVFSAGQ